MAECFVRTTMAGEGNASQEMFQENTRYCDCLPLTEYDDDGNHKWNITMTIQNETCCKADYTCREGYHSRQSGLPLSRFCDLQNDWNHTEPDCRKIDTDRNDVSSVVLHVSVPGALLAVLFVCLLVFVIWWRRRAKYHSNTAIDTIKTDERNTAVNCHVKQGQEHELIQYQPTLLDKAQTNVAFDNETSLCTNTKRDKCGGSGTAGTLNLDTVSPEVVLGPD